MKLILASKSPRRRELMSQIGLEYECVVSDREETIKGNDPKETVMSLSLQKAEDVFNIVKSRKEHEEDFIVIGADTVVALEGRIMGKPKDKEAAEAMLKSLSGKFHSVWTGVTVLSSDLKQKETFAMETKVYMYPISDKEMEEYLASKEPYDKAGSYAIQGLGSKFIERIEGDYNNVVGLPVSALYQRIKHML